MILATLVVCIQFLLRSMIAPAGRAAAAGKKKEKQKKKKRNIGKRSRPKRWIFPPQSQPPTSFRLQSCPLPHPAAAARPRR